MPPADGESKLGRYQKNVKPYDCRVVKQIPPGKRLPAQLADATLVWSLFAGVGLLTRQELAEPSCSLTANLRVVASNQPLYVNGSTLMKGAP